MADTIQAYLIGVASGPLLCALVVAIYAALPTKRRRP